MAPAGAPTWVQDREALWNSVEARELRKDSQLARVIEVGLPLELSSDEHVALMRDFIAKEFVAKGMIADFFVRTNANNPHAHILLTLRGVTQSGFGPKERRWNRKSALLEWRSAWATRANEHLARAGYAVQIDHRTLEAQQIELTPGRRIGVRRRRQSETALPSHVAERLAEQKLIAKENGQTILDDPTVGLRAITHQRPIFTYPELVQFLRSRTESQAQLDAVLLAITQSSDLVAVDSTDVGQRRFTSRDMIEAEKSLIRRAASMASRRGHGVDPDRQSHVLSQHPLDYEQQRAFAYLVSEGDVKAIAVTNSTKAGLLTAARHAWDAQGLTVKDTTQSLVEMWRQGSDLAAPGTVLLLDASPTMGLKQLERVLAVADKARAKAVLIGDMDQLHAIHVESPFRNLLRQVGPPEFAESGTGLSTGVSEEYHQP
jgi:ATP-dependent exoDNAse (exonuclease V) alpha subunit